MSINHIIVEIFFHYIYNICKIQEVNSAIFLWVLLQFSFLCLSSRSFMVGLEIHKTSCRPFVVRKVNENNYNFLSQFDNPYSTEYGRIWLMFFVNYLSHPTKLIVQCYRQLATLYIHTQMIYIYIFAKMVRDCMSYHQVMKMVIWYLDSKQSYSAIASLLHSKATAHC